MENVQIVGENIITVEEIKEEPNDHAEEQIANFTEGGVPCSVKREVKDEDNEEEELKPPVSVFLNPEEVSDEVVGEVSEDPLAICSENCNSNMAIWSSSGECDTTDDFSDPVTHIHDGTSSSLSCNEGNCTTLGKTEVKGNENPILNNHSTEEDSRFPELNCAKQEHENPVSVKSPSECGYEVGIEQKDASGYECAICNKNFTLKNNLARHMQIHTGVRPHACSICEKRFRERSSLITHMQIHSDERPYECSLCKMSFKRKEDLVVHVQIHSGERPHVCPVCHKGFTVKYSLNKHMRIHTGERPHECSICQKRFTQSGTLTKHMLVHNDHECSVCQKSFRQSRDLVRHFLIHSKELPYKCPVCQKGFINRRSVLSHMRVRRCQSPFECSVCRMTFSERSILDTHMHVHKWRFLSQKHEIRNSTRT